MQHTLTLTFIFKEHNLNVNITQIIFCAYVRFTGRVLRAGITK